MPSITRQRALPREETDMKPSTSLPLLLVTLLGLLGAGFATAETSPDIPPLERPETGLWVGPGDQPLPFASEAELLDFLREARVVERKRLSAGINRPFKLTLERGGVRAHAIFRSVDERIHLSPTGAQHKIFYDSYRFEVAAYELSRLLGLDNVPPTVLREIGGVPGSVQLWVEGATSEASRRRKGLPRASVGRWFLETQMMALFDNLIFNYDRNAGNVLFDGTGKVWFVDHTRSFKNQGVLAKPEEISVVDRAVWQRLQNLDEGEVRRRLRPYLDSLAVQAIVERQRKLVRWIDDMIEERGADRVLFDLAPVG